MGESLRKSLLGATFIGAMLVSRVYAQDNVGCSNQRFADQYQSETTITLSEDMPDNQCSAFNTCCPKSRFETSASLLLATWLRESCVFDTDNPRALPIATLERSSSQSRIYSRLQRRHALYR